MHLHYRILHFVFHSPHPASINITTAHRSPSVLAEVEGHLAVDTHTQVVVHH
jgi:hypothetical protein